MGETRFRTGKPGPFSVWRNEKGIALLVAIVVVVLMVALIVEFDYGTRISLTTAGTFRNGTQATFLAKSGVRGAQAVLREDGKSPGKKIDHLGEFWATPVPPYPIGNGQVSIVIEDESSKLNINLLGKSADDYNKWKEVWKRLLRSFEVDDAEEIVVAMKDWIDGDGIPEDLYGVEASYYERLDPPYTTKDGPLDSLGELLLIKGVTPEVYALLTTGCDGGPCVTIAPTTKINVNTVSRPVCRALHDHLNEEDCQDLEELRPIEGVASNADFPPGWGGGASGTGIRNDLNTMSGGYIDVKSEYFLIRSIGQVQETHKVILALVHRKGKTTQLLSWRVL